MDNCPCKLELSVELRGTKEWLQGQPLETGGEMTSVVLAQWAVCCERHPWKSNMALSGKKVKGSVIISPIKGGIIVNEHGYIGSRNCLLLTDEIASLIDKWNDAVKVRTFNILQQTKLCVKFCFIWYKGLKQDYRPKQCWNSVISDLPLWPENVTGGWNKIYFLSTNYFRLNSIFSAMEKA